MLPFVCVCQGWVLGKNIKFVEAYLSLKGYIGGYSSCHEEGVLGGWGTGKGGDFMLTVNRLVPFFKKNKFIYLFFYGCVGSSFLREGFLQLRRAGATLHRGARASHYRSFSCCGAQAPDAQAQ